MPEVHNLPPDNGSDKDPEKWENADEKDRRGIRKVFDTQKRVDQAKIKSPRDFDPAASAKVAAKVQERLKKGKIESPDKGDRRFPREGK